MAADVATERRRAILAAAVEVFATRGHRDTRIQDIADAAGVAYGLVYHYFGSKDALLATVFDENWAVFADVVEAICASDRTVDDKVRAVLDYAFGALEADPARLLVILREYGRRAQEGQALQHPHVGRAVAALGGAFREARDAGTLQRDADPDALPVLLLGALQAGIFSDLSADTPLDPDDVRRTVLALFRAVLVADAGGT